MSAGSSDSESVIIEKVALPEAQGQMFTSVAMGPDDKLYAATLDGFIHRFTLDGDGTTGAPQVIDSVRTANGGGARTIIGLAFDPAATATNPILWITDNDPAFSDAADWTGRVSRLSGSDLQDVQDVVVGVAVGDVAHGSVEISRTQACDHGAALQEAAQGGQEPHDLLPPHLA